MVNLWLIVNLCFVPGFSFILRSRWFPHQVYCDWDMLKTSEWHCNIHAVARAVAGCPVYVSDTADDTCAARSVKLRREGWRTGVFFCQTKLVYCKNPWSIYLGDSTQQVMTWYCRATRANEWTFWTVCFQHVSFPSNLATGSNMFQHISNVCIQIVPPTERQLNDWAVTPSPRRHHIWWWVL